MNKRAQPKEGFRGHQTDLPTSRAGIASALVVCNSTKSDLVINRSSAPADPFGCKNRQECWPPASTKNQACCSARFDFGFLFPVAFAGFADLMRATAA